VRHARWTYTFDAFRKDVKARVRLLNRRLVDPGVSWPGVLILDLPDGGLSAEAFDLPSDERELAELADETLPARIRDATARRFCWIMPVWREGISRQECLLLVFGERDRVDASLAVVVRSPQRGPRLGPVNDGALGPGTRRVSGRFVDGMARAFVDHSLLA
jgi:hypothetical protein